SLERNAALASDMAGGAELTHRAEDAGEQASRLWHKTRTALDDLTDRISSDAGRLTTERFASIDEAARYGSWTTALGLGTSSVLLAAIALLARALVIRPILAASAALRHVYERTGTLALPSTPILEFGTIFAAVRRLNRLVRDLDAARHAAEQAREKLRSSEARYRAVFAQGGVGIIQTDLDGRFIEVNPAFAHMMGFAEADLAGRSWNDLAHPDDMPRCREGVQTLVGGRRRQVAFEKRYLTRDGQVVWANVVISTVTPEPNRPHILVGMVVDITDRKRTEEELRQARAIRQLIMDSIPEFIFWKDKDSRYLGANINFSRAAGYEEIEDLIGKSDHDLPWTRAQTTRALASDREVLETRQPKYHYVETQTQADGRTRWIEASKVPLFDAAGEVMGVLGSYSDITERRRTEYQLQHMMGALQRSNADLEQFAYVASHDLREPLRMVTSYLTLLERRYAEHLDNSAREFIGFARDGALRMDRLILDLLEYSRVGRRGKPFAPVRAEDVITSALSNLKVAIDESGAHLTVARDLPAVMGEPSELERLFQNLIGNALKYRSPDRPPEIT
ncbi:MAG: PAS domain S-box protein, partial [Rhodospirillales bacterium]|nr:PAS domain S-box protein [Rhodospirillales bacterium]